MLERDSNLRPALRALLLGIGLSGKPHGTFGLL
jgi:hypothetical protein